MLRRLKGLGATTKELLDVYHKQVRSVLEMAVPVWHPAITQQEAKQVERIQKCALYIILGNNYTSYNDALELIEIDSLQNRRSKICEKFAKNCLKSQRYSTWFQSNQFTQPTHNTRSEKSQLKSVSTRTQRYKNSSIPYLTELLNKMK